MKMSLNYLLYIRWICIYILIQEEYELNIKGLQTFHVSVYAKIDLGIEIQFL
jgi:hypothetical protein